MLSLLRASPDPLACLSHVFPQSRRQLLPPTRGARTEKISKQETPPDPDSQSLQAKGPLRFPPFHSSSGGNSCPTSQSPRREQTRSPLSGWGGVLPGYVTNGFVLLLEAGWGSTLPSALWPCGLGHHWNIAQGRCMAWWRYSWDFSTPSRNHGTQMHLEGNFETIRSVHVQTINPPLNDSRPSTYCNVTHHSPHASFVQQ